MIKTKIICTIGPASESIEILEKLAKEGMNIARLNFSHGNYDEHLARIERIKEINKKLEVPIAILLDTQGPEIRLGKFKENAILKEGSHVTLTIREIECNEEIISISYKKLPSTVKNGDLIYIADGTIELKVKELKGDDVLCEVIVGGEVGTKKNVSIPGAFIDLPSISNKDRKDIEFGSKHGIDFVAMSFVRTAKDILEMKKILKGHNSHASVIAKIEGPEAMKNIDEIISVADGVMVARGDLGVQIPIEQVPNAQKMIIKKCDCAAKPVIVATQMLESMTKNSRPTRAEVTDVANAIFDGTDAIMLSGETAAGKYPVRAVEMMVKIAKQTEAKLSYGGMNGCRLTSETDDAISRSVCQLANDLNAALILTCTFSGHTAKMISKNRPMTPVVAATPHIEVLRKLNLCWGVYPLIIPVSHDTDKLINDAIKIVKKKGIVKKDELVVLTAGIPFATAGNTNFIKVETVD